MRKIIKKHRKLIFIVGGCILTLLVVFLFLLYGPISFFRDTWITSAMTTKNHQYLARLFYSDEVIQEVLAKHKVIEPNEISDPDLIVSTTSSHSVYEEQILTKEKGNDLYKVIEIKGVGYRGYLVAIYDPSKVVLATSKYLGIKGEKITTVAKENKATIAMNAGGFYDPEWNGPGGLPHGTVIQNGTVVSDYIDASVGGGFIGFTYDDKLVLGKMTVEEALAIGYRDAVEFGPFLIVNGKSSFITGNGGWGIAPRTVIGQRQDGIVLFLVIDGRTVSSIGTDMLDLTKIMERYGAYNAANLDGGSSTELWIDGKIINNPVASGKDGLRNMPTFWIVKQ